MRVIELVFVTWEYVCSNCKQFRGSSEKTIPIKCGNCHSTRIFVSVGGKIKLRGEA
jgi:DNA-directed RNA polymerase subunit RPC12/RpoP